MARLTFRFISLATLLFAISHAQALPTPADLASAESASTAWLGLVDIRRYPESYDASAPAMKSLVPRAAFEHATATIRAPLGKLTKRTVKSVKAIKAPKVDSKDGFIAVEYSSSFEALDATTESVLLTLQDGEWHPFSYAVKREGDPTPGQVRMILRDRIDTAHRGVGIVVAISDKTGRRVIAHGSTAREGGKPVDGDTLFEIGSITKVFTGLLLADAVVRGEVSLDDPVSKYLPASVKTLKAGGTDVTLLQLATHTSGLPRVPSNMAVKDSDNPYADYTVEQLYETLNLFDHPAPVKAGVQYSNLGMGLLGHVLALRAGTNYESLLRSRVLEPLGMKDTVIALDAQKKARFARPHLATLYPTPAWELPALAGAGALRSTANDMLKFAEAHLGKKPTALDAAIRLALRPADAAGSQGLGWSVRNNGELAMHTGATGGSTSYIALDNKEKRAFVVMGNSANAIIDIGNHLFSRDQPLLYSPVQVMRKKIRLADPTAFDRYVGTYSLTSDFSITITRQGDRYFSQATSQGPFEIFPASESLFFLKALEAALEFSTNAAGQVTHLTLLQNGAA
ncbi:MAG: serine hydrolase, partial [Usitatibacter sp.]